MAVPTPPTAAQLATYTPLTDPNPNASWTPALSSGVDYWLKMHSAVRDHQLIITGGRNIYIDAFHTTRADTNGGPNFMIEGGHQARTIFFHGGLMDCTGGFESDGIRTRIGTRDPSKGAVGATDIVMLECRITALRGQTGSSTVFPDFPAAGDERDDFGNSSAATHADCIQLAGGANKVWLGYCTLQSRYANLQLQREQTETSGNFNFISTLNRVGSTVTVTTAAAHGLAVGDFIQVGKGIGVGASVAPLTGTDATPSSSGWNGTYIVATRPSSTQITYDIGDLPSTSTFTNAGSATWKESHFNYNCGDFELDHVDIHCSPNQQMYITGSPDQTINIWRIGARPDYKGYEDQTPMTRDGWTGTFTMNEVYVKPYTGAVSSLMNPGSGGSVYSGVRANINTGVSPNEITYPSWSAVTGKAFVGSPTGGDFAPAWKVGLNYPRVRR